MSMHDCSYAPQPTSPVQQFDAFRQGYYQSLTCRADTLFELTDALLCTQRKAIDLAHLSLQPEHHHGYGALYDAINHGRINLDALTSKLGAVPVAKIPGPDGRNQIVLAVDVSNWLRPDAACSPERAFCHTYARNGQAQMVPGWPYSFVASLESGATSWTAITADQLRNVVNRLIATGQQQGTDPEVLVVMDAG